MKRCISHDHPGNQSTELYIMCGLFITMSCVVSACDGPCLSGPGDGGYCIMQSYMYGMSVYSANTDIVVGDS